MAGDWTAIEHATIKKPEIGSLMARTGRSQHECLGLMVHFWGWAEAQTVDGKIAMPVSVIPLFVGGDAAFWEAVQSVGWLECLSDGTLLIPRADHWITKGAKNRLKDTRRKQLARGNLPDKTVTTEEKRTEETPKGSLSELNTDPVPLPPPNGLEGHRGGRSASVFDGITAEVLRDRFQLRDWFHAQSKAKRPVLNSKDPDAWTLCLAAALHAKHEGNNPPAMFASLVGGKNGRSRIKQKHWNRAAEVAREFPSTNGVPR